MPQLEADNHDPLGQRLAEETKLRRAAAELLATIHKIFPLNGSVQRRSRGTTNVREKMIRANGWEICIVQAKEAEAGLPPNSCETALNASRGDLIRYKMHSIEMAHVNEEGDSAFSFSFAENARVLFDFDVFPGLWAEPAFVEHALDSVTALTRFLDNWFQQESRGVVPDPTTPYPPEI